MVLISTRVIPGSDRTKSELEAGVTLVEQFKKLLNNETAIQADYSATLAMWSRL